MTRPADPIRLRPRVAEDEALLREMFAEFRAYLASIDPYEQDIDGWSRLASAGLADDPFMRTRIVEYDGAPAGYVAHFLGCWEIYRALYIAGLFVRPMFRGRGLGRRMLNAARGWACEAGAERVVWSVWRENTAAIEFYEHIGAERMDEEIQMVLTVAPEN